MIYTKFISILFLFSTLGCSKSLQQINKPSENEEIYLNKTEIKYIYHEAMRHTLYNEIPFYGILSTIYDLYDYKSDINCNHQDLSMVVYINNNNFYLKEYLLKNKILSFRMIKTSQVIKNTDFHFQLPIKKQVFKDTIYTSDPPDIAFFHFSDIAQVNENTYYISVLYIHTIHFDGNTILDKDVLYTFEFEKCKSGIIRFKKMIGGSGNVSSSHGIIETVKKISDLPDCYNGN